MEIFLTLFEIDSIGIFNFLHFLEFSLFNIDYLPHIKLASAIVSIKVLLRLIVFIDFARFSGV